MKIIVYEQIILFVTMFVVAILFSPSNILVNTTKDLYISNTLIFSAISLASNIIWSYQIVNLINNKNFNIYIFIIGIFLSAFTSIYLLRNQYFINDIDWLKMMVNNNSNIITITEKLLNNNKNFKKNPEIYRLAKDLVVQMKNDNTLMKTYL